MNVTLKNGKQGKVVISKADANARVEVEGKSFLVAFVRDAKKVVVKNDLLLTDGDLNHVKAELNKFVRKPEDTKKAKRR